MHFLSLLSIKVCHTYFHKRAHSNKIVISFLCRKCILCQQLGILFFYSFLSQFIQHFLTFYLHICDNVLTYTYVRLGTDKSVSFYGKRKLRSLFSVPLLQR